MKLGAREFLRYFYWTLRRNQTAERKWAAAVHMLAVLPGSIRTALHLVRRIRMTGDRRPKMAIALVEHMGDIVAAEPIAHLARQRFPDAWICWIARAPYASLPASYPEIDHVATVGCLTEWMLVQRLGLFDIVWDLHINDRICPQCSIPQVKPGVLPDQQNYYDYGSLLDVQCLAAGLPKLTTGPVLMPSPAAVTTADALALPSRFIAIHCVSNDTRRDWPADKWEELVTRILTADPTVTVVELGLRALVVPRDNPRLRALCGTLSILETAEVIRRTALFIGIDSGLAHLANAVGTRGVILLGSYVGFRSYMPYSGGYASGEAANIVRTNGPVADVPVDAVFDAVMAALAGEPPPDSDSMCPILH